MMEYIDEVAEWPDIPPEEQERILKAIRRPGVVHWPPLEWFPMRGQVPMTDEMRERMDEPVFKPGPRGE